MLVDHLLPRVDRSGQMQTNHVLRAIPEEIGLIDLDMNKAIWSSAPGRRASVPVPAARSSFPSYRRADDVVAIFLPICLEVQNSVFIRRGRVCGVCHLPALDCVSSD
jgi:hypothetical protein